MKIILLCSAGMSTSLLVKKMLSASSNRGLAEVVIEAHAIDDIYDKIENFDVVLLGPQVAFKEDSIRKICKTYNKPVTVIPPMVYGLVDGEQALDLAFQLHKNA